MFAPRIEYHSSELHKLVTFDVRYPGLAERLHGQRAVWQEHSDIEALDQHHFVLMSVWADAAERSLA